MKAAILAQSNAPLVVADILLPSELQFGQVLVLVHYSGICGAQINEIEAAKGPDKFLPHLLGHEGSATVVDVGPGVWTVRKGDRVVMHWRPSAGLQCDPPKYRWGDRWVNAGWVTTFNEYAVVSENRLTVIPPNFDLRLAPLFGCAVTTAMGVVNNDAQLKVGQSLVVFGVGGVGLNIVQSAAMVSAYPIIAIDRFDHKLELAMAHGASCAINADHEDVTAKVPQLLGGLADVVVDTTGSARVIETAYGLTHPDGKTILVGVPRQGDNISIYSLPLHFNKTLRGSHGGDCQPDLDIPRYVRLMEAGKMSLAGFITHEFKLEEINEALDVMRRGAAGRVLLAVNPA